MKSEKDLKLQIVEIGRHLYNRGFIAAGDGNISVRLDDSILTTPRSVCKGFLTPDMIVKVSLDGKQKLEGDRDASSELPMHLLIYEERHDVRAVVHAHPPCGTGYAAAGQALDKALVSEVVLTLGCIPLAAYGTPSTNELTDAMRPLVKYHDALLMANHGAVAYGSDLETAHGRMETLEHVARISLVARLLGGERELSRENIDKLIDLREKSGYMSSDKRCQVCGFMNTHLTENDRENEEVISLKKSELVELVKRASQLVLAAK
ncbi:MAG: class II aldolase/adducin family protein [Blastocatellia bacterium]|nr:class II aldolase/adducin family protein [Blastocatellia bacterium]